MDDPQQLTVPDIPKLKRPSFARSNVEGKDFRNRFFQDVNALDAKFAHCDFSYSVFYRAYFRNAIFEKCKFVGCIFVDSHLRGIRVYATDLRFSKFQRTQVDVDEIVSNLSSEPNIRREALQNLLANSREVGDFESQRKLILQEIKATRDHHWRAFTGADKYHKQKYASLGAKATALWNWLTINVSGWIWGNGESARNIIVSAAIILLLLSAVNTGVVLPRTGGGYLTEAFGTLKYTVSLFLDLPTDAHFRGLQSVDYIVALLRYVYVGLYVSVLFRIISRR